MPYAMCIFILQVLLACNRREYTLTIVSWKPNGKQAEELHRISAADDSSAYARGATLYFLTLYAYSKMSDESKVYISKPVKFSVIDETGKSVDSVIGIEKAETIRQRLDTVIN